MQSSKLRQTINANNIAPKFQSLKVSKSKSPLAGNASHRIAHIIMQPKFLSAHCLPERFSRAALSFPLVCLVSFKILKCDSLYLATLCNIIATSAFATQPKSSGSRTRVETVVWATPRTSDEKNCDLSAKSLIPAKQRSFLLAKVAHVDERLATNPLCATSRDCDSESLRGRAVRSNGRPSSRALAE